MLQNVYPLLTLYCYTPELCVNIEQIETVFSVNKGIEAVWIVAPLNESLEHSHLTIKPSSLLIKNPIHVKHVYVHSLYASIPWSQVSWLMKHFLILNNTFLKPKTNQEVYVDLKDPYKSLTILQGLRLVVGTYNNNSLAELGDNYHERNYGDFELNGSNVLLKCSDNGKFSNDAQRRYRSGQEGDSHGENINNTSATDLMNNPMSKSLRPLSGLETVNCLILEWWQEFPVILQKYLWPELSYIELLSNHVNLTQILALNRIAPRLTYLKLWFFIGEIPDFMWKFDWDSLPWRTGFVLAFYGIPRNFTGRFRLMSGGKMESPKMPPVHFHYSFSIITRRDDQTNFGKAASIDRHPVHQYLDFSYSQLESLGYFQATLIKNMNLYLNFSHNNFSQVDFMNRFHSKNSLIKQQTKNNFSPMMLDLSYNQLDDPRVDNNDDVAMAAGSDFLLLPHLQELYLQHNSFTRLPQYAEYYYRVSGNNRKTIKDLKKLRILDISHNYITEINPEDLIADDFSPLQRISFKNNSLVNLPSSVFQARYLTHADFSNNRILFSNIWPSDIGLQSQSKRLTYIYLGGNSISDLDISILSHSQIDYLHNILENFDLHLDGNPINCDCKTHRMYRYLVSQSKSERTNVTWDILPDFSSYKSCWKCMMPSQWNGIPLMQIPEYQYETMCKTLEHCPEKCFCYHSWKLGDVITAKCSHDNKHLLSTLPQELPDKTTHLDMSGNNLQNLCSVSPYLGYLKVLDVSRNKIEDICPEILMNLQDLMKFNLTQNQLKKLPEELELMTDLTKLDISNNQLEDLPKYIQNMTKLKDVVISGNIFRCDCDTFWMTGWMLKSSLVKHSESLVCFSGKGQGKYLIDLHEDDVGCNDPLIHAVIGLATTVILVATFGAVIYRYRGYIKVWLYTRFGFHPWDQVQENPQEMDYDAFVSFSRKDADWVFDTLMPHLEAPQCGYHLCVHDRDFVPGATINKNIITAIKYSRRTILVLTPDFIKSGWCDFEFQAAHKRVIDDRSNFLIIVLLKEVDVKDLDETLKLYMKTNTYVTVNDKWFWQKLLYAMPKVPIDKLKAQQNIRDDMNDGNSNNDGNNRNGVNNSKDGNKRRDGNKRNGVNDIGLGAAGGLDHEGAEDVPLLNMEFRDGDNDDVALLIDLGDINEHHADNNQQGKIPENGARFHYHHPISHISSSDGDVTTDSDEKEFDQHQVYQSHAPGRNRHAVARLPPLFKRINTYNDVLK